MKGYCYDPTIITKPKTSYIQTISTLFNPMTPANPAVNLAFPYHRHLKSSSPRLPAQDNEIIATTFGNYCEIHDHGKICGSQLISLGGRDWGFMILECFKKIYESLPHQT
jgi:hypothetical protein